jgi:hypothetical protein
MNFGLINLRDVGRASAEVGSATSIRDRHDAPILR